MNAWPPQPGFTVMQSDLVELRAHLAHDLGRRARVEGQAGAAAGLADRCAARGGRAASPRRGR